MKKLWLFLSVSITVLMLNACTLGVNSSEDSITIFSERHYDTDQMLFDLFTEQTGIEVNVIDGNADQLINRLENEGEDTSADVLIIADAGRLHRAKSRDLLQPVESDTLFNNIPSNYRDADNYWFGLTKRARVLVYHPDRVDASELSTYEALTDTQFEGRIVTRTSTNIYNQSLMASFIEIMGEEAAKNFATGLVNNFARTPSGNDRDQAKAVVQGIADIAIMNTYYIGRMMNSSDSFEQEVADTVEVFFPNQETTGTHVNISAAGVTKHASNLEGAIQFIEFLSGEEAQSSFANANFEYPVNEAVEVHELLSSWGEFKAQDINLSVLGENSYQATIIMDEVGWE